METTTLSKANKIDKEIKEIRDFIKDVKVVNPNNINFFNNKNDKMTYCLHLQDEIIIKKVISLSIKCFKDKLDVLEKQFKKL